MIATPPITDPLLPIKNPPIVYRQPPIMFHIPTNYNGGAANHCISPTSLPITSSPPPGTERWGGAPVPFIPPAAPVSLGGTVMAVTPTTGSSSGIVSDNPVNVMIGNPEGTVGNQPFGGPAPVTPSICVPSSLGPITNPTSNQPGIVSPSMLAVLAGGIIVWLLVRHKL